MNIHLHTVGIRHLVYVFVHRGVYPLMALVFLAICAFQVYMVHLTQEDLNREEQTLEVLHTRLKKYSQNARISEEDRVVYGSILKRQIPSHNNTFDTFALIESLYSSTGIELKTGGSAQGENPRGITFTALATLTSHSLQELMNRYQYEFPRFLTLTAIQVTRSPVVSEEELFDVRLTFQAHTVPTTKETKSGDMSTNFTATDVANFETFKQRANTDWYFANETESEATEEEYIPANKLF